MLIRLQVGAFALAINFVPWVQRLQEVASERHHFPLHPHMEQPLAGPSHRLGKQEHDDSLTTLSEQPPPPLGEHTH